jgi:uncharacterized phage protein (TIGR02218 family)
MTKVISLALATHKALTSTTLTDLLLIGPLDDGTYRGLTLLDADLAYDDGNGSVTYKARTGVEVSTLQSSADLGVDNAEANTLLALGAFPIEGFTQAQIDSGALDTAPFVVYRVNYRDLTMGHEIIAGGTIGEVRQKVGGLVVLELRSLSQQLKQSVVELDSKSCRARFGSQPIGTGGGVVEERFPCGFDVSTLWVSGAVEAVGDEGDLEFADTSLGQGVDHFAPGVVEWLTGANAGQKTEVDSFSEGTFVLQFPTVNPIQLGDTFRARPDCTKQWFDGHNSCSTFWGSQKALHFRGEPHIPTGDSAQLNTPGAAIGSATAPGSTTSYPPPETPGTPSTPGGRTYGANVVDPVTCGADPTGASDSTAAFNNAYAALPVGGGIVRPSAGTYKINPTVSVKPLSNTLLDLATHNVTLQASYTALDHKYVVWIQDVDNVEVAGGTIIGYRAAWSPISGTTSEWGHCIACYGSTRVTVRDCTLKDAVGDGMSIGGHAGTPCADIVVDNVITDNNRRQGLSIVWAVKYGGTGPGVTVTDSTFGNTNGTSPECGIDIEPESGQAVEGVVIDNCIFQDNAKYGINLLKRSNATGATIDDITITNCLIGGDTTLGNHSNGVVLSGGSNVTLDGNTVSYNSATGLRSTSVVNLTVTNNTFKNNYARNGTGSGRTAHLIASGLPTETRDLVIVTAGSGQSITNNTFWY